MTAEKAAQNAANQALAVSKAIEYLKQLTVKEFESIFE